jgi:hypothetical protein
MPRLTDEQIRKIIWNIKVNQRVDQREKTFGWQANEAIAQAQYDQDMKEFEQAKQEVAKELFEKLSWKMSDNAYYALKSKYLKEEVSK